MFPFVGSLKVLKGVVVCCSKQRGVVSHVQLEGAPACQSSAPQSIPIARYATDASVPIAQYKLEMTDNNHKQENKTHNHCH